VGGIVGGITDAVGLTNNKGEKQAAAAAAQANAQSYAMSQEQIALAKEELQFQKDQYADWKTVYGPIQDNLGSYYKTLTPDKLIALGLEKQQQEFQQVQKSIKRDFAQRGIDESGVAVITEAQNKVQNATARAAIRASGDDMVNKEKMNFLGIGLNQGTEMLGVVGNAAANVTNAYSAGINSRTSIANAYLGRATAVGNSNRSAMSDIIGSAAYLGAS
jgi:hypothetical protein